MSVSFARLGMFLFASGMMVWCISCTSTIFSSNNEEEIERARKRAGDVFRVAILIFIALIAAKQLFG